MKTWDKGKPIHKKVEQFTVGNDPVLDMHLAPYEVLGSLAHARMLERIGLFTPAELDSVQEALRAIYRRIQEGNYAITEGVEDIHSQLEMDLTKSLGELGKKIHTGRSRNDQVLVDLRLYMRDEIKETAFLVKDLLNTLLHQSEKHKDQLMPGYTHMQMAMPSSFGLWFGAYAESLADDLLLLLAAYQLVNRNPLGSAAGYGTSIPINRSITTALLGFEDMNYNSLYCQMSRTKVEIALLNAMAAIAATLGRFSTDSCLFICQNFGFMHLPDDFTTGSSIMPHKKNPDVFEIIRGKCNLIQGFPGEATLMSCNHPSGYFRDYQLLKELMIRGFEELASCLGMTRLAAENITTEPDILNDEKYSCLFSVEAVNRKVMEGVSFRDAYREIADDIAAGRYKPVKELKHVHEGSIGNLCNEQIQQRMEKILNDFNFAKSEKAVEDLLTC